MSDLFDRLMRYSHLAVALAAVTVVIMLVVPLPSVLLDLFIAANISGALFLLITTMYVPRALDLASFPSILLLTTLFRLSINVSVTRLILLHGDAGAMIRSFGQFVVGGNLVVGIVVFLILVIIQFVVITNGAGRIAEVAARFTLDAMPGKQLAIDADLNAGQLTEQQANQRRKEVTQEADFYGAMDGASKFVKGDAVAGLIIVTINLIGGIIIGVVEQHLAITDAISKFSILTIGDGISAQIPALLISTGTGILVTRAASSSNLGEDISRQLTGQPRALLIAGGVVTAFGVVPGLPPLPFFILGVSMLAVGRAMRDKEKKASAKEIAETPAAVADPDDPSAALGVDPLELVIGYALIPLADDRSGGDLVPRVRTIRRQIAAELGLVIPMIRIHDAVELNSHEYVVRIRGAEVDRGQIHAGHVLAIPTGDVLGDLDGIKTTDPAFGLPAVWVPEAQRRTAESYGYTVADPASIIVTHLTESIRRNVGQLLTRQETKKLLDEYKVHNEAAVTEVVPDRLTVGEVQRVLQRLLDENVAIRDLGAILEAIGDRATQTRDPVLLAEFAREALGRSLTQGMLDDRRVLRVITIAPAVEHEIAGTLTETVNGELTSMDPSRQQQIVAEIVSQRDAATERAVRPVVICSGRLRRHIRRMIAQAAPTLPVISYNEVPLGLDVQTVSQVG